MRRVAMCIGCARVRTDFVSPFLRGRCKSKLQVLSFITEPDVIKNILKSVRMATVPPEMAWFNFKSEQTDFIYEYDYAE